jgi:hypothetical protein
VKFDYTYKIIYGLKIYEPGVIVTNLILLLICIWFFIKLMSLKNIYSRNMAGFILMLGLSGCIGAVIHATHYQLGWSFLRIMNFASNVINILVAFLCFRGSYHIQNYRTRRNRNTMLNVSLVWLIAVIIYAWVRSDFIVITIHAGLVLLYAFYTHYRLDKNEFAGTTWVMGGIVVAFFSILVHLFKLSFHHWFNHKDLAHIFMIASLLLMGKGILMNSRVLEHTRSTA